MDARLLGTLEYYLFDLVFAQIVNLYGNDVPVWLARVGERFPPLVFISTLGLENYSCPRGFAPWAGIIFQPLG